MVSRLLPALLLLGIAVAAGLPTTPRRLGFLAGPGDMPVVWPVETPDPATDYVHRSVEVGTPVSPCPVVKCPNATRLPCFENCKLANFTRMKALAASAAAASEEALRAAAAVTAGRATPSAEAAAAYEASRGAVRAVYAAQGTASQALAEAKGLGGELQRLREDLRAAAAARAEALGEALQAPASTGVRPSVASPSLITAAKVMRGGAVDLQP